MHGWLQRAGVQSRPQSVKPFRNKRLLLLEQCAGYEKNQRKYAARHENID